MTGRSDGVSGVALVELYYSIPQISFQNIYLMLLQVLGELNFTGSVGFGFGHCFFIFNQLVNCFPGLFRIMGHDHFYPIVLQCFSCFFQKGR
ncbi:MAG: hypothetical protein A4E61_00190 [Syntrophorhabdus sp. PtaB.Bin184]|nr:MAG: hypothetical protein A4E61_00190 [Syntrophorhabdus sp. PtaB.Bin184]